MRWENLEPGMKVAYVPLHTSGNVLHGDVEYGEVSSMGVMPSRGSNAHHPNGIVHVKFDVHVKRFGWDGATSQACDPFDLVLVAPAIQTV